MIGDHETIAGCPNRRFGTPGKLGTRPFELLGANFEKRFTSAI